MSSLIKICLFVTYFWTFDVQARLVVVPVEYQTIESAVLASLPDDTVLVMPGQYVESIDLPCRDVRIFGNALLSNDTNEISSTVWHSLTGQRHVEGGSCEGDWNVWLGGITFNGGSALGEQPSGGISIDGADLRIRNCRFDSCYFSDGGALYTRSCVTLIDGCRFAHSSCSHSGRFAYLDNSRTSLDGIEVTQSNSSNPQASLIANAGGYMDIASSLFSQNNLHLAMEFFEILDDLDTLYLNNVIFRNNSFNSLFSFQNSPSIELISVHGSVFEFNSISHDVFSGFTLPGGTTVSITSNVFAANSVPDGFRSEAFVVLRSNILFTVKNNLFVSNDWTDFVAIAASEMSPTTTVERNYFIENRSRSGSFVAAVVQLSNNRDCSFKENIFLENLCYGAVSNFADLPPGHAENNYWGHASGPFNEWSNPEGLGDSVDTLILYEPWEEDTLFLSAPDERDVPITFALGYPFPNPFNSSVTIEYALTREQDIRLEIFDVLGRQVETLLHERQGMGVHSVVWKAEALASGLYFARLSSHDRALTAKLMLLK